MQLPGRAQLGGFFACCAIDCLAGMQVGLDGPRQLHSHVCILSRKLEESARTVNWSTHTWPLQHVGLRRAGLLTSQLRAPRASVLMIKTDTP